MALESSTPNICFQCNSDYKVTKINDVWVCSGICRKQYLRWQEKNKESKKADVEDNNNVKTVAKDNVKTVAKDNNVKTVAQDNNVNTVAKTATMADMPEWKVGDPCRAFYLEEEYEAVIMSIDADADGNKYGNVRFVGYNNEETVWLADIVASYGEKAVKKQKEDAAADAGNVEKHAEREPEVKEPEIKEKPAEPDVVEKSAEPEVAIAPEVATKATPEVPPPLRRPWQVGDFCRGPFEGIDYEGIVQAINEKDGTCNVKVIISICFVTLNLKFSLHSLWVMATARNYNSPNFRLPWEKMLDLNRRQKLDKKRTHSRYERLNLHTRKKDVLFWPKIGPFNVTIFFNRSETLAAASLRALTTRP